MSILKSMRAMEEQPKKVSGIHLCSRTVHGLHVCSLAVKQNLNFFEVIYSFFVYGRRYLTADFILAVRIFSSVILLLKMNLSIIFSFKIFFWNRKLDMVILMFFCLFQSLELNNVKKVLS